MKINANKNYLKTYCVPFGRSHLVRCREINHAGKIKIDCEF